MAVNSTIGPVNWPRPRCDWESMSDDEARWAWSTLEQQYLDICNQTQEFDPDIPKAKAMPLVRRYWDCVDNILLGFVLLTNQGRAPHPPPLTLLMHLRLTASSLASGTAPRYVTDAISAGSAAPTPRARDDIAYAIAYVLAARSGMLDDDAPFSGVADAFEVSEKTVRNWVKDIERYPPTRTIPLDGAYLAEVMPERGKQYSTKERVKNGGRKPKR